MAISIPNSYYSLLAQIESGGNPNASSSSSSASGLYGMLSSTASAVGGDIQTLTQQNAQALVNNGLPVNSQNLYTLHFLGQGQGLGALTAPINAPLSAIVDPNVLTSNPQLKGFTAGDLTDWTANLVSGGSVSSGGYDPTPNFDESGGTFPGGVSEGAKTFKSITDWITNLFSAHTATRAAFVVVGIALVIIAAIFLAASTKTGQTVINNVKDGAKGALDAAVVAA